MTFNGLRREDLDGEVPDDNGLVCGSGVPLACRLMGDRCDPTSIGVDGAFAALDRDPRAGALVFFMICKPHALQ